MKKRKRHPVRLLPPIACPGCDCKLTWNRNHQVFPCGKCKIAWNRDGKENHRMLFEDEELCGIVDAVLTDEEIEWAMVLAKEYNLK